MPHGGKRESAGAPIGNSNAQKTTRYICNCKGVEQSFATAKSLNKHKKANTYLRLIDPEFAKTEAANKAEVKCKRKREKDSKAVQQADARKRLRLSKQRYTSNIDHFSFSGGVKLMNELGVLNEHTTDLSPIMSSYL